MKILHAVFRILSRFSVRFIHMIVVHQKNSTYCMHVLEVNVEFLDGKRFHKCIQ